MMPLNKSALSAMLALAVPAFLSAPSQAGIMHRHPVATGLVAGMAAHHMAKTHGHGFMHRHPMMTGLAAGAVAHHMAKHHG